MVKAWMMRAGLVAALFAMLAAPGRAEESTVAPDLAGRIGPRTPYRIVSVAPSPTWQTDGLVLALREVGTFDTDLTRTRDGGQTWQCLELPDKDAGRQEIWSVQAPSGRIAFKRSGRSDKGRLSLDFVLDRSTDDGDSWAEVWNDRAYRMSLAFSPTFASDGLAFVMGDRRLMRSTDAGLTWTPVALAGEKGTEAVAFSPAFATDRTVVASVAAIGMNNAPIVRPGTNEPDTEAGLLLSSDGGVSWSPMALPSTGGKTYPRVTQMVLSPTFAEDGTLFVEAMDSWRLLTADPVATLAVFRSTDRGLTWEKATPALSPEVESVEAPELVQLALSPSFAEDRTVFLGTRARSDAANPNGRCWVRRSTDAGTTWSEKQEVAPTHDCGPLEIQQGPDGTVAVAAHGLSYDLGATWLSPTLPAGAGLTEIQASRAIRQDRTLLLGLTRGGVMLVGKGAQSAAGRVICDVPPADEVARFYDADPWFADWLGCPGGPPSPASSPSIARRSTDATSGHRFRGRFAIV
jgi:photosystem II stability/assembly factor-like uncharacterized protein